MVKLTRRDFDLGVWARSGLPHWAAYCETCNRETTDPVKCRDCGTSLEDAPTRWPWEPPLAPDMLDELWPKRDDLEAEEAA